MIVMQSVVVAREREDALPDFARQVPEACWEARRVGMLRKSNWIGMAAAHGLVRVVAVHGLVCAAAAPAPILAALRCVVHDELLRLFVALDCDFRLSGGFHAACMRPQGQGLADVTMK